MKARAPIKLTGIAERAANLTEPAVQWIVDPQRIAAAARCPGTGQSINWTKTIGIKHQSLAVWADVACAAKHSTAQHSTAQHQSCPVKVSGRQMIASRMCRTHHCSAAISAVMLTACCQCEPVCNLRRSHCKCMQAGRLLLSSTKGELQLDGCVPFGSTSRRSSNSMIRCCPSCT